MAYPIRKVGVVGGAGTMGSGISIVTARYRPVVVKEQSEALVEKAKSTIYGSFQRGFDSGNVKTQNELEQLKSNVTFTADLQDLAGVDLVIEAIPEKMEWKKKLFSELDKIMPSHVILASNTSSLPITLIAEATARPDRVMGTHFFNPPTKMDLVELIRGRETSDETMDSVQRFCRTLEKKTIRAADQPGFYVNRVLLPYIGEGIMLLEQNEVSAKAVDAEARKLGFLMGPFRMLDIVGLDTAYDVAKFMAESYPDKIQIGTLLKVLIDAGRLGKKSGVGFNDFDGTHEPLEGFLGRTYGSRPKILAEEVFTRMLVRFLNESVQALEDKVASKGDIETGAKYGVTFPKGGPLHYISEIGLPNFVEQLNNYAKALGSRYTPARMLVDMAEKGETFYKIV